MPITPGSIVSSGSRQPSQSQVDEYRKRVNASERTTQQLEAQVEAEMQDRMLRNEEISLLLERIAHLDSECATRQGDIATTDRLYADMQSQGSEIETLQAQLAHAWSTPGMVRTITIVRGDDWQTQSLGIKAEMPPQYVG